MFRLMAVRLRHRQQPQVSSLMVAEAVFRLRPRRLFGFLGMGPSPLPSIPTVRSRTTHKRLRLSLIETIPNIQQELKAGTLHIDVDFERAKHRWKR